MAARPPRQPMDRASRVQFVAIVVVVLVVAAAGILVVAFPRQFGLPGRHATPAAVVATPGP